MVSSTAAATLRQLVMFVVDKVVDEDRQGVSDSTLMKEQILPDGSKKDLGPSARDAYAVFEDLCLLANAEKPHFLNLEYLHKTFALELIESVLTNYHDLFRKVCPGIPSGFAADQKNVAYRASVTATTSLMSASSKISL